MNYFYLRILLLCCSMQLVPTTGIAQDSYSLISDTLYTMLAGDVYSELFLLAGDDHMIFLNGDSIRKYDDIQRVYAPDAFLGTEMTGLVVERGGRTYLINEDYELYPEEGLPFTIADFNGELRLLDRVGNTLAFRNEDGVYVVNATTRTKKLAMDHGRPLMKNERQLWIKNYDDEFFFFHPERQEILPYSYEDMGLPYWDHDSIIVTHKSDDDFNSTYAVLDFDLQPIVGYDRGFTECYIRSDMAILNSSYRSLLLRGPSDTTLLEGVKEVQMTVNPEVFTVFHVNGQKYFIDRFGKRIDKRTFRSVENSILRKGIFAKDKIQSYFFSSSGDLLISGKYDNIQYLYDDRFVVTNNRRRAVVNGAGEVILPYRWETLQNLMYGNIGPIKEPLIFSNPHKDTIMVHNIFGEKIITWNPNADIRFVDAGAHQWSYSLPALAALTDKQAVQLNANNAWRVSRKMDGKKQYQLVRRNGAPITGWYNSIFSTPISGVYVIGSKNEKYRLIRVTSDYSLD